MNNYTDEACLRGDYRGRVLAREEVDQFPYNCFGVVKASEGKNFTNGTGTLIGERIVITAAHTFYKFGKFKTFEAAKAYFCPGVYKNLAN